MQGLSYIIYFNSTNKSFPPHFEFTKSQNPFHWHSVVESLIGRIRNLRKMPLMAGWNWWPVSIVAWILFKSNVGLMRFWASYFTLLLPSQVWTLGDWFYASHPVWGRGEGHCSQWGCSTVWFELWRKQTQVLNFDIKDMARPTFKIQKICWFVKFSSNFIIDNENLLPQIPNAADWGLYDAVLNQSFSHTL